MRTHPFRIGGLATLIGIGVWILEWHLQLHALNPVVLSAMIVAFIALIFCVPRLASPLFHSWRPAVVLWFLLSASSIAALIAAIPFRMWMPRWANDGSRRWYYEGMPQPENDHVRWLSGWHRHEPHLFEAALLCILFALVIVPCVRCRIHRRSAAILCLSGCALLAIATVWRDLLVFDYDVFHLGIALDSIALSIWPMGIGHSNAHTIFTLGFLAIIFSVSRAFLALQPGRPGHPAPPSHPSNP